MGAQNQKYLCADQKIKIKSFFTGSLRINGSTDLAFTQNIFFEKRYYAPYPIQGDYKKTDFIFLDS